MKNADIEKGLRACSAGASADCRKCPYYSNGCSVSLVKDAFRYINRLKMNLREAQRAGGKKHDNP